MRRNGRLAGPSGNDCEPGERPRNVKRIADENLRGRFVGFLGELRVSPLPAACLLREPELDHLRNFRGGFLAIRVRQTLHYGELSDRKDSITVNPFLRLGSFPYQEQFFDHDPYREATGAR